MPHNTTLLQIPIPDLPDPANVPQDLHNAFTRTERYTCIPCTSSTRPASPHAGMRIFETNTGTLRYWNGATWAREKALNFIGGASALLTGSTGGGATPSSSGDTLVQIIGGTAVATASSEGTLPIGFPGSGFPNGLITVVANVGDVTNFGTGGVVPYTYTRTGFWVRIPGAVGGANVRINYIALGW